MAAMTKGQLKAIIKECLLEVLAEGLGHDAVNESIGRQGLQLSGRSQTQRPMPRRQPTFDPVLDSRPRSNLNPALEAAIRSNSGGDQTLMKILADTAKTTLVEQQAHEGSTGANMPVEQFNGTPEDNFGAETAARWASLAFMNTPMTK